MDPICLHQTQLWLSTIACNFQAIFSNSNPTSKRALQKPTMDSKHNAPVRRERGRERECVGSVCVLGEPWSELLAQHFLLCKYCCCCACAWIFLGMRILLKAALYVMYSHSDLLFHATRNILTQNTLLPSSKSVLSSVLTPLLAPCGIFDSFLLLDSIWGALILPV